LYDILVKPVEKELHAINKLVIIPDGDLALIPFEALVADSAVEPGQEGFHCLIHDVEITYNYSGSVWALNPGDDHVDGIPGRFPQRVSGYAPQFGGRAKELPFAGDEIRRVCRLKGSPCARGKAGLSFTASELDFRKGSRDDRWIHLATHSLVSEEFPERTGLMFTACDPGENPNPANDGFLSLEEIYNLGLDADLVVLSACSSGKGKLTRSEGMISLGRGFTYAGASNVVSSLWNVTDRHTRDLMVRFYTHLASGSTYSDALRRAKLEMIARPETSLPLFWAGFVLYGK